MKKPDTTSLVYLFWEYYSFTHIDFRVFKELRILFITKFQRVNIKHFYENAQKRKISNKYLALINS